MSSDAECTLTVEDLIPDLKADNIKVTPKELDDIRKGDKTKMSDIGMLYSNKSKYKKAIQWYLMVDDIGSSIPATNIGQLYELGFGVPVDYLQTLKWYLRGARLGDKHASYSIASLFEHGLGVPADKEITVEWYFKYDEDADFLKRYQMEGNKISDRQKEKPLGQMIKEANHVLSTEGEKKKTEKRQHINSYEQDMTKMHRLERDYNDLLDLVADLKDILEHDHNSNKRKYERMYAEIRELRHITFDLVNDNKHLLQNTFYRMIHPILMMVKRENIKVK